MKPELLELIVCPRCANPQLEAAAEQLHCTQCGYQVALRDGIPLFTPPPPGLVPSEKLVRGPEVGTPWRQANWRFLQQQLERLAPEAVILDVGAGRGDFGALLDGRHSLALDVYPYPEIDLVCDLTRVVPLRPGCLDAILLMNVMEHVSDTHALLETLAGLLKPDGVLIVAIPFLVKIHQAPVDFVRYTHFALPLLGEAHGLQVELLEGYYDPLFFLGEGLGNLRNSVLPTLPGSRRYLARLLLASIETLAHGLGTLAGKGRSQSPASMRSLAPTGYHVVYRRVHTTIKELQ